MPRLIWCAVLVVLFSSSFSFGRSKDEHDSRLRTVKSVFISGNNKQAQEARKKLLNSKACFALASKTPEADAVLDVKEAQEDEILHTRGASAELTLKSGEMIWSDYRMAGGDRLMWQLIHDACH